VKGDGKPSPFSICHLRFEIGLCPKSLSFLSPHCDNLAPVPVIKINLIRTAQRIIQTGGKGMRRSWFIAISLLLAFSYDILASESVSAGK
jgi:hypothetical protein